MFQIHPRLLADTLPLCGLTLCEVRLMNDRRFPWLILIPKRPAITAVHQLNLADQQQLISESSHASMALEQLYTPDKINVAALGNLVPQLHWHVVARRSDDPCWPGPIWGCGQPIAYTEAECAHHIATLQAWFNDD
ncbi:HIT domain-containing protein [Sedimenticola selenatireducens]|nr:HIT family protein [Sedimenticola selenatireducens]